MKGFPNQITDLQKITTGLACLVEIEDSGENGKDDGVFGEALVHAGVAGTGHAPRPIAEYLEEQREKPKAKQSFRTTARGLRELYRLMELVDDTGDELEVTVLGRQAAAFSGRPWDDEQITFWRRVIRNIEHRDANGTSHPYQILLRLVARKPGIPRAKCALALAANNDSPEELQRLVDIADESEEDIRALLGVSRPNWDNAKKVLPRFAEQLKDVVRGHGGSFVLADAPGRAEDGPAAAADPKQARRRKAEAPRAPRSSRTVTSETIGNAGIGDQRDELPPPPGVNPEALNAARMLIADRLRRHNLIVRAFSKLFEYAGATLYEDPFDLLAILEETGVLTEVKSLDGTASDERDRVRDALGQLLYYESFLTGAVAGEATVCKIACFETKITDAHLNWLNQHDIGVVWQVEGRFVGDDLARKLLGRFLKEFR